jgi:hypothetical protein
MPCFDHRLMLQDEHAAWAAHNAAKDRNPNDAELSRLHNNAAALPARRCPGCALVGGKADRRRH